MIFHDSTFGLRRDPYRYVRRHCASKGSDAFETRLLLEPALCMTGVDAARFFYDETQFTRTDAAPGFLTATLFGEGGVQGLDGAAHRHRKAQFLALVGPGRTDALSRGAVSGIEGLAGRGRITLQDALEEVLTEAVCDWSGIPVAAAEVPMRSRMLSHLFEHAASVDLRQILARRARDRAEDWAGEQIEAVRAGRLTPPPDAALAAIAGWRDLEDRLLPPGVAAVELLNVLRPFVAISAFLTFAAHALATCEGEAVRLRADPERVPRFVQEVRRVYPFFPLVVARARRELRWRTFRIPEGQLVALDLWGTNRDPSAWEDPDQFRPDRFIDWTGDPFTLIPQGGGDHAEEHRCPGEWVTRDVMEAGTRALLDLVDWNDLLRQDLSLNMRNLPGLPRDRMVVCA